jgi:hypothetical protein
MICFENLKVSDSYIQRRTFMKKTYRLTLDELMEFLTTWLKQKI